jgi:hypothetical protein
MHPLESGVCFRDAGLDAHAELKMKFSIPSPVGFFSWIVPGQSVTMEGAKSASINTKGCTHHNPLFLNPLIAVSIIAALGNAMPTSDAMCFVNGHCPGISLSFIAITDAMYVFNGVKNLISRGCIRHMLWECNDSMTTPCL